MVFTIYSKPNGLSNLIQDSEMEFQWMIKVERNLENAPELVEAVQSSDDAAAAQTEGVVTTLEADVVDTLLIKLRIH